jgi:hypothetical protein
MSRAVARFVRAAHSASHRRKIARIHAAGGGTIEKFSESQMCPSNGHFWRVQAGCSGPQAPLLTAFSPRAADTSTAPGTRDSPRKKNFADFAESRLQTGAEGSNRIN